MSENATRYTRTRRPANPGEARRLAFLATRDALTGYAGELREGTADGRIGYARKAREVGRLTLTSRDWRQARRKVLASMPESDRAAIEAGLAGAPQ